MLFDSFVLMSLVSKLAGPVEISHVDVVIIKNGDYLNYNSVVLHLRVERLFPELLTELCELCSLYSLSVVSWYTSIAPQ
jgi:hypothetical protein